VELHSVELHSVELHSVELHSVELHSVELHMPLYFFDIRDDENLFKDEEGLSFPDFESAEREAAEAAACILRDSRRQNGRLSKVTIEVRDEHQRCVTAASALIQIERRIET
jgi:hypothetical protein